MNRTCVGNSFLTLSSNSPTLSAGTAPVVKLETEVSPIIDSISGPVAGSSPVIDQLVAALSENIGYISSAKSAVLPEFEQTVDDTIEELSKTLLACGNAAKATRKYQEDTASSDINANRDRLERDLLEDVSILVDHRIRRLYAAATPSADGTTRTSPELDEFISTVSSKINALINEFELVKRGIQVATLQARNISLAIHAGYDPEEPHDAIYDGLLWQISNGKFVITNESAFRNKVPAFTKEMQGLSSYTQMVNSPALVKALGELGSGASDNLDVVAGPIANGVDTRHLLKSIGNGPIMDRVNWILKTAKIFNEDTSKELEKSVTVDIPAILQELKAEATK